jgi:error-prone DNA polymerase
VKLRRGMSQNGITGKTQDEIVQSIASFALYGFPESHAASFALIAYASAYLKCHYLAAFTAAILNNQPMGFYQPFTLIKDAQRHGLKVRPVDVTRSDWLCTIEEERVSGVGRRVSDNDDSHDRHPTPDTRHLVLRLGLRYVKGLSEQAGQAIVRERARRPFLGIDDLHNRVPELRKDELRKLAAVGALNFIQADVRQTSVYRGWGKDLAGGQANDKLKYDHPSRAAPLGTPVVGQNAHRRDALWQVERVARLAGPLYEELHEADGNSPLAPMTVPERVAADFHGTGLTIGRHPVAHHREQLNKLGALRAIDIRSLRNGRSVRVAGWVIVRQRPGTAKGFMFLTLEDETGVANVIITPRLFDKNRLVLVDHPFLLIEGTLQNQDNVISVKANRVRPLSFKVAAAPSHDFH